MNSSCPLSFMTQLQQVQAWQIKQQHMIRKFKEDSEKSLPTYSEFLENQNCGRASSTQSIPISLNPPPGFYRQIATSDEALFPVARTQLFRNCF
jgi:hypothetical protein